MAKSLHKMEEEHHEPVLVMTKVADSLPAFGIVAAVLGIIVVMMFKIGGDTAVVGQGIATALAGTFFEEMHKYRRSGFEESRVDLLDSNQAEQTLRAMALFSSLTPTKTVGQRSRSSYGIKHVAERMTFDLGDGVILAPGYVSNVDAIIAALDRDFKVKHHGGNSPNVDIGISVASLRAAQAEQKPNKLLA